MGFGDHAADHKLSAAWKQFCQQLEAAGDQAFKDHNPATDLHRADAFRFLTQNLGQAFDLGFETRDPDFPLLHQFCTPNCKLGGDAADLTYHQAWIKGDSVYRVSGHRGSARFINFTVQGRRPDTQPGTDIPSLHDPFGDIPEANLFGHDLRSNDEGNFELFIGGPEQGANWLPSTPETRKLFIRQGFDRWDELPASLTIERVGMAEPRPAPSSAQMISGMEWAGRFVSGLMSDWPDHPYQYSPFVDPAQLNVFPDDPAVQGEDDRKRGRAVANMCWALADDEALIVEFDALPSFWMISLMGVFFNSLDFCYRPISYTPARSVVDDDGKVRLILSHRDPGYANWLDTQGFERGNLCYRNLLSPGCPAFRTQTVKHHALSEALPKGSVRVSSEERTQQLKTRFDSIRRRYGN